MNSISRVLGACVALFPGLPDSMAEPPGFSPLPEPVAVRPHAHSAADAILTAHTCPGADFAQQVVERVNAERSANGGLPPLKRDPSLDFAAATHSSDMALSNFFAHCNLDTGMTPWQRMVAAGYDWDRAGENIATGHTNADQVMDAWMASGGHRANILNSDFREIGVGYFYTAPDSPDTRTDANGDCTADGELGFSTYHYWTQNFGRRGDVFPLVIEDEAGVATDRDVRLYVYGEGWADDMRLRTADGEWSAWMPFSSAAAWRLPAVDGMHRVEVEMRHPGGSVRSAFDDICLEGVEDAGESLFDDGFEG